MATFAPLIRRPAAKPPVAANAGSSPPTKLPPSSLPFATEVQRAFGRHHDVGSIRAHSGAEATAAGQAIGARAYARGSHVVFAEPPTLERAAHEATHVVQQRAGEATEGMPAARAAFLERDAAAVATRVRAGQAADDLLPPYRPLASPTEALQRDATPGAPRLEPASTGVVEAVLAALAKPDAVAGVGDFKAAFAALDPLPMEQLLSVLSEIDRRGSLDLLLGNEGVALQLGNGERIVGAIRAVRAGRLGGPSAPQERLVSDAERIGAVSVADLNAIMQYFAGILPTVAAEGMLAMAMMSSTTALFPGAVAAGGGGTVGPGPFTPPGKQPIPFYIGLSAHDQIANLYRSEHPGDVVRTNNIAMSTILALLGTLGKANNPSALKPSDLGLEPDITNLTKLHLYEIKPESMRSLAETESKLYMGLFIAAGIPMTLGPTTEPGTAGIVPAPGGYYAFESPEPGVILYQYRRGQFVPVPVPVPVESKQPQEESDFMKKMRELTGLTGKALIVYIIISEGSRLFPPRNLAPVP